MRRVVKILMDSAHASTAFLKLIMARLKVRCQVKDVLCVYHREVSVEGVEGVADKGTGFGGHDFPSDLIEDN